MKRILLLAMGVFVCVVSGQGYCSNYFSDEFTSFDANKWDLNLSGGGSFTIDNEEAKFTIRNYCVFLKSKPIDILDWESVTLSGQWRIVSAITPEYLITIYDADNESNWLQVTYKSWDDASHSTKPALRFSDSANSPTTVDSLYRTPPSQMTDFSIHLTGTTWEFTEGSESWIYNSTTLADATSFEIRIGGWDASSLTNQIVYYDNLEVTAIPEPTAMVLLTTGAVMLLRRRWG
ncbi:MAG: PEP-CTERM sorting domain-containing protein [Planctomycetes bacterium]|nr:PEP-CTERM sorting domain-containing protein [Planctomycetota bacterium]